MYYISLEREGGVVKEDRALLYANKRKLEGRPNEVYMGALHSTAVFTANQQNYFQTYESGRWVKEDSTLYYTQT